MLNKNGSLHLNIQITAFLNSAYRIDVVELSTSAILLDGGLSVQTPDKMCSLQLDGCFL